MNRFKGKSVLVTGCDRGIGLATARACAAEGARVVITGRNSATLELARVSLGETVLAICSDAGDPTAMKPLASALEKEGIKLDAVFINASVAAFAEFSNVDEASWNEVFDVNVRSTYFQIQALLPLLNPGASIAVNGVISARVGVSNTSNDSAVEASVFSGGEELPVELPPRGGLSARARRRVLEHIESNLEGSIRLDDLAETAGLSVHHFARAFKQSMGMSPHRYLVQRRVQRAAQLLGATDWSLAEIALQVGFADQSHLSRNFNRFTGSTPNAFRRAQG